MAHIQPTLISCWKLGLCIKEVSFATKASRCSLTFVIFGQLEWELWVWFQLWGQMLAKAKTIRYSTSPSPPLNDKPTWYCSEVIQLDELSEPGLPPRVGAGLEGVTNNLEGFCALLCVGLNQPAHLGDEDTHSSEQGQCTPVLILSVLQVPETTRN